MVEIVIYAYRYLKNVKQLIAFRLPYMRDLYKNCISKRPTLVKFASVRSKEILIHKPFFTSICYEINKRE